MACSLLRLSLAHVYGATELERNWNCLVVMKANMAQVVTRADFHFALAALGPLAPEAFVKFNLHCAGIEHVEPGRRRKRGEE